MRWIAWQQCVLHKHSVCEGQPELPLKGKQNISSFSLLIPSLSFSKISFSSFFRNKGDGCLTCLSSSFHPYGFLGPSRTQQLLSFYFCDINFVISRWWCQLCEIMMMFVIAEGTRWESDGIRISLSWGFSFSRHFSLLLMWVSFPECFHVDEVWWGHLRSLCFEQTLQLLFSSKLDIVLV